MAIQSCYRRAMSTVVMERIFKDPPTDEQLEEMKEATETCLEINASSRINTFANGDRSRFICVFEGPDLEAIRRAVESAGIEYETMWTATVF
jgi:hypothetical protein